MLFIFLGLDDLCYFLSAYISFPSSSDKKSSPLLSPIYLVLVRMPLGPTEGIVSSNGSLVFRKWSQGIGTRSQGNNKVQRESQHEVVLSRWPPPLWELMLNSYMPIDGSGELLFIGPIELLSGGNILGTDAAVVTGASGGDKRNCIGAQVLLHPQSSVLAS